MSFETTYANPKGRTSRGQFIAALVVLVAVAAFYVFLVKAGRNGQWVEATLLFPGFVLLARRLHDMGLTGWLVLIPGALMVAAFGVWLDLISLGPQLQPVEPKIALAVTAAFALWGAVGKGKAEANKFGEPATA